MKSISDMIRGYNDPELHSIKYDLDSIDNGSGLSEVAQAKFYVTSLVVIDITLTSSSITFE